ncbi:MAG TPA: MFS transporter [Ilumatobacteraceae bacterium]|nr:MFS transporter [Ilumatobacteraceae bacterium]
MTSPEVAPNARPLHEDPAIYARRWFLLGVMCLSLVMVVMGVSGLNTAIPSIQRDLDATATDLQWIFDSYAIVFAGFLLTAGALGDRFGRKRALVFGLGVFGVGGAIGTFADTSTVVIVSRSVMGLGAAFVMPSTLSLLTSIFPPDERRKAIALWAGFAGAGGALGPLIVGFLLTDWWIFPSHWWGSTFLVNTIAAAVVLVVVVILAPESKDEEVTPLDPVGAVLSLVGLAALLYAIIEGPTKGWSSTPVVGGFVVAAIALGAFIWWEFHTEHPMLPMSFFRERGFSTGSGVITFAFFVMFGFFFLIGQYVQFVRGYSPLESGLALMPFAFMLILVAPRSAKLGERFGLNAMVVAGFIGMTVGFVLFTFVGPDSSYWEILAGLIVLGGSMGITAAPATGAIMSSVPLNRAGVGSAVNDTSREVGGALGIAVLGSIATSAYRGSVDVSGVPAEAAAAAGESVGAAVQVASELSGPQAAALVEHAGVAFTDALNTTMAAGAVVAVLSAIAVYMSGRRDGRRAAEATAERSAADVTGGIAT